MKKYLIGALLIILAYICFPFGNAEKVNTRINKIVFIDPGHGGYDPGTNSDGILEKEINLKISTFLYEEIINNSGMAFITRSNDYDLSNVNSSNHKLEDMNKRVKAINNSGADILISIHLNALRDTSVYGPMVYYRKNDYSSLQLAELIQSDLNEFSGLKKKVHPETYFLFKHTSIPAVLIECGFLSNPNERKLLNQDHYQKSLATCIFNSLIKYSSFS